VNPFSLGPRAIALYNVVRYMNLYVGGAHHLPAHGPAIVAARHYHHAFDGSALVHGLARQPHLFVALDWTNSAFGRHMMERACRLAQWPVALRGERFDADATEGSAFDRREMQRYTRHAISYAAELLGRGEVLAIFPEGYPTIDPRGSRKTRDDEYLPFRAGLIAIAAHAERAGVPPIPIVPAGLAYAREGARTRVTLRLGAPLRDVTRRARADVLAELEARVRDLSHG